MSNCNISRMRCTLNSAGIDTAQVQLFAEHMTVDVVCETVGGPVIADDNLVVARVVLLRQGLELLADETLCVMGGDDH